MNLGKTGSVVTKIKQAIVDMEGKVSVSEFYLTNSDTGEEVNFCMPPEELRVKTSGLFRTFNVIESGEIKLPKGEQLKDISWHGLLPGAGMLMYPFIKHSAWEDPQEIIKVLERWKSGGEKLRLLVTETPVNLDVFIKSFDWRAKGGLGHYDYDIDFIAAKTLQVRTVAEADAARSQAKTDASLALRLRALKKSKAGMLIGKINTIFEVAKLLTGNGGSWDKIASGAGITQPHKMLDPTTYVMH